MTGFGCNVIWVPLAHRNNGSGTEIILARYSVLPLQGNVLVFGCQARIISAVVGGGMAVFTCVPIRAPRPRSCPQIWPCTRHARAGKLSHMDPYDSLSMQPTLPTINEPQSAHKACAHTRRSQSIGPGALTIVVQLFSSPRPCHHSVARKCTARSPVSVSTLRQTLNRGPAAQLRTHPRTSYPTRHGRQYVHRVAFT